LQRYVRFLINPAGGVHEVIGIVEWFWRIVDEISEAHHADVTNSAP